MIAIENQRKQVDELLNRIKNHDWDRLAELFSGSSPAYEDVASNSRLTGHSGIREAYRQWATALPDLQIQISRGIDHPACSIRELVVIGTHLGNYHTFKATGRPVQFACACFFLFDNDGLLSVERVYYDNATLFRQMNGETNMYYPTALRAAA